jgi:hypothetical protein
MDTNAAAEHPPLSRPSSWTWPRPRSSVVAECLLCGARAVQSGNRPRCGRSILSQVTINRRAVCGRPASTVRREGGPGQPGLPTPIADRPRAFAPKAPGGSPGVTQTTPWDCRIFLTR